MFSLPQESLLVCSAAQEFSLPQESLLVCSAVQEFSQFSNPDLTTDDYNLLLNVQVSMNAV